MRRKYFGLAIAAIATFGPMQAWGGDREIAEQIIKRLKSNRDSGALKDFTLDASEQTESDLGMHHSDVDKHFEEARQRALRALSDSLPLRPLA